MTKCKRFLSSTLALASLLVGTVTRPSPCDARQFTQALPGYKFSFPRDHASHDDYRTEWWYFTGHLNVDDNEKSGALGDKANNNKTPNHYDSQKSATARSFGYELTFFRLGLDQNDKNSSPWSLKNLYLAHFAISDPEGHKFVYKEKMNRAGMQVADAKQDRPYVYNEGWSMEQLGDEISLRADTPEFNLHLLLTGEKPVTIHGKDGVSQKASCKGCASHYYSMTDLESKGTLVLENKNFNVHGMTWMDHEFGSNQMTDKQVGWDWYSIQLEDKTEVMLYVMRNADGTFDPMSGTVVNPDGSTRHLELKDFAIKSTGSWTSNKTHAKYPMGWHVSIPSLKSELDIDPDLKDQELVTTSSTGVTYWEGTCTVKGTESGHAAKGKSYVEMTGYAEKFSKQI